ncbi:MAG: PilW family protein [Proteobacteria bacterium]|nr:PilW family protein [Pseudomonadota bacterium]
MKFTRGFSLVEIMVALVIGMIAMIVVLQIYGASEANKRTTTGGDDAQISGALGMFALQRDIRQAGVGISSYDLLGCNVTLRAGVTLNTMIPVTINHPSVTGLAGQDLNTDTLLVVYGNSSLLPEGASIFGQLAQNQYTVDSPSGFSLNDNVIAAPQVRPSPCALTMEQVNAAPAGTVVTVPTGVASMSNGRLYNLGPAPTIVVYAVRGGSLTRCDFMVNDCTQNTPANWVTVAGNIVSLKAQYGRDDASVNPATIDYNPRYVNRYDATIQAPPAVTTVQCGFARVSAVRVALLARSGQYDKNVVTGAVPTWEGSVANNPTGSAANAFNLTNIVLQAGESWQNYRYKVNQMVVPIKAMSWISLGGKTC